ncbi:MAG: histidine biosynthesis protein HisIE, partial [Nitrospira sp.]
RLAAAQAAIAEGDAKTTVKKAVPARAKAAKVVKAVRRAKATQTAKAVKVTKASRRPSSTTRKKR